MEYGDFWLMVMVVGGADGAGWARGEEEMKLEPTMGSIEMHYK